MQKIIDPRKYWSYLIWHHNHVIALFQLLNLSKARNNTALWHMIFEIYEHYHCISFIIWIWCFIIIYVRCCSYTIQLMNHFVLFLNGSCEKHANIIESKLKKQTNSQLRNEWFNEQWFSRWYQSMFVHERVQYTIKSQQMMQCHTTTCCLNYK